MKTKTTKLKTITTKDDTKYQRRIGRYPFESIIIIIQRKYTNSYMLYMTIL